MSRIGNAPVRMPAKVDLEIKGTEAVVKGPLGQISLKIPPGIRIEKNGDMVHVKRSDDSKEQRALHGLTRALLNNHVRGVTTGWVKSLELVGVGYRVAMKGRQLVLSLGYSHDVNYNLPPDIEAKVEQTKIELKGIDRQRLGQIAAEIRSFRPPEPYKGKGIRYAEEVVRRKAGKTGKAGKGGKGGKK
jgi:large subunit ribosomal protein L6